MKKRIFTLLIAFLAINGLQAQDGGNGQACQGISTVTDIDGNIYNTVLIGDQCWMKENLKTTQYRDGTPIENPTNNADWMSDTNSAYAWYDNDISWKDSYGALYNWNAVNNANGLCPIGWHVPSDAEWTQLVEYVEAQGFPNQWDNPDGASNALKSCRQENSPLGGDCDITEHPRWDAVDTHHGFDAFGFSGLPGGRYGIGGFSHIGDYGHWWSATEHRMEDNSLNAWNRGMNHVFGTMDRFSSYKTTGLSVRCVRD